MSKEKIENSHLLYHAMYVKGVHEMYWRFCVPIVAKALGFKKLCIKVFFVYKYRVRLAIQYMCTYGHVRQRLKTEANWCACNSWKLAVLPMLIGMYSVHYCWVYTVCIHTIAFDNNACFDNTHIRASLTDTLTRNTTCVCGIPVGEHCPWTFPTLSVCHTCHLRAVTWYHMKMLNKKKLSYW